MKKHRKPMLSLPLIMFLGITACSGTGYFSKQYKGAFGDKYTERRKLKENIFIESGGYKPKKKQLGATEGQETAFRASDHRYAMSELPREMPIMNQKILASGMPHPLTEQGSGSWYDDEEEEKLEQVGNLSAPAMVVTADENLNSLLPEDRDAKAQPAVHHQGMELQSSGSGELTDSHPASNTAAVAKETRKKHSPNSQKSSSSKLHRQEQVDQENALQLSAQVNQQYAAISMIAQEMQITNDLSTAPQPMTEQAADSSKASDVVASIAAASEFFGEMGPSLLSQIRANLQSVIHFSSLLYNADADPLASELLQNSLHIHIPRITDEQLKEGKDQTLSNFAMHRNVNQEL